MEPLEKRLRTLEAAKAACLKYPENENLLPYVLKELREVKELIALRDEYEAEHR